MKRVITIIGMLVTSIVNADFIQVPTTQSDLIAYAHARVVRVTGWLRSDKMNAGLFDFKVSRFEDVVTGLRRQSVNISIQNPSVNDAYEYVLQLKDEDAQVVLEGRNEFALQIQNGQWSVPSGTWVIKKFHLPPALFVRIPDDVVNAQIIDPVGRTAEEIGVYDFGNNQKRLLMRTDYGIRYPSYSILFTRADGVQNYVSIGNALPVSNTGSMNGEIRDHVIGVAGLLDLSWLELRQQDTLVVDLADESTLFEAGGAVGAILVNVQHNHLSVALHNADFSIVRNTVYKREKGGLRFIQSGHGFRSKPVLLFELSEIQNGEYYIVLHRSSGNG